MGKDRRSSPAEQRKGSFLLRTMLDNMLEPVKYCISLKVKLELGQMCQGNLRNLW